MNIENWKQVMKIEKKVSQDGIMYDELKKDEQWWWSAMTNEVQWRLKIEGGRRRVIKIEYRRRVKKSYEESWWSAMTCIPPDPDPRGNLFYFMILCHRFNGMKYCNKKNKRLYFNKEIRNNNNTLLEIYFGRD